MNWILWSDILIVGLLITGTIFTEIESFGWATLVLVAALVGAQLLHVVPLLGWASTHIWQTVLGMVVYLAAGVVWSFVKWFSFLVGFRDNYRDLKVAFVNYVKDNGGKIYIRNSTINQLKTGPQYTVVDLTEPWNVDTTQRFLDQNQYVNYHGNSVCALPTAAHNKERILGWMSFWPMSLVGTLLNDPVRKLFTWIFNSIKGLYQRLAVLVLGKEGLN